MRVTVMGLGLHGGGLATVRYLLQQGATVTVTDLRDATALQPSIDAINDRRVHFVIGRHEVADFSGADLVVKNPAVRRNNPFLRHAHAATTDIQLFAAELRRRGIAPPLIGITGSKGKSTTAAAAHHILLGSYPDAQLGGNITVSPLTFLDQVGPNTPVVLELSSFQLGDLAWCIEWNRIHAGPAWLRDGLQLRVAVITNILRDHQDYYENMDAYVADKRRIYQGIHPGGRLILSADDPWTPMFRAEAGVPTWLVHQDLQVSSASPYSDPTDIEQQPAAAQLPHFDAAHLVPTQPAVPGPHARMNVGVAALIAWELDVPPTVIAARAASFTGIAHRLETVARHGAIRFVNDSAATIPEATAAATNSFPHPIVLITGGTDKALDLSPIVAASRRARAVVLLSGTATDRMRALLDEAGLTYAGPCDSLEGALAAAINAAKATIATERPAEVVVLFSPGCASFGMFLNEFDRGRRFCRLVEAQTAHREAAG